MHIISPTRTSAAIAAYVEDSALPCRNIKPHMRNRLDFVAFVRNGSSRSRLTTTITASDFADCYALHVMLHWVSMKKTSPLYIGSRSTYGGAFNCLQMGPDAFTGLDNLMGKLTHRMLRSDCHKGRLDSGILGSGRFGFKAPTQHRTSSCRLTNQILGRRSIMGRVSSM